LACGNGVNHGGIMGEKAKDESGKKGTYAILQRECVNELIIVVG